MRLRCGPRTSIYRGASGPAATFSTGYRPTGGCSASEAQRPHWRNATSAEEQLGARGRSIVLPPRAGAQSRQLVRRVFVLADEMLAQRRAEEVVAGDPANLPVPPWYTPSVGRGPPRLQASDERPIEPSALSSGAEVS